jgi:hypothetical protein
MPDEITTYVSRYAPARQSRDVDERDSRRSRLAIVAGGGSS